jgi:acylphosphatase
MPKCYRFIVHGLVQGVGFRQATVRTADCLSLDGWVRNREDGCVEGAVSGTNPESLLEFRHWLDRGPPQSRVKRVDWTEGTEPDSTDTGFVIRR